MFIILKKGVLPGETQAVLRAVADLGLRGESLTVGEIQAIALTGEPLPEPVVFERLPGVDRVAAVRDSTRLASRALVPEGSRVPLGTRFAGAGDLCIIAGPCAVEGEEAYLELAGKLKAAGVDALRGGAWKPRTSPYSFQGLGRPALEILSRARAATGLAVVTEAVDEASLDLVADYADMIQIGSRSMANYSLLRKAGRCGRPVFLKRGMAATLEELLQAAEYVLSEGNPGVILCERGIRTFSQHSRFTLDVAAVPALKEATHLPVFIDPSHASGVRRRVGALARAGVAAGCDGVMIEVHANPASALSDGPQALLPDEFARLAGELRAIAKIVRQVAEVAS